MASLLLILIVLALTPLLCVGVEAKTVNDNAINSQKIPFLVLLEIRQGRELRRCSGALLNGNFVLTAAHCLIDESKVDVVNNQDVTVLFADSVIDDSHTVDIESMVIHPNYNLTNPETGNDLALLKIGLPLEFLEEVRPIELAYEQTVLGDRVTFAGWSNQKDNPYIITTKKVEMSVKICNSAIENISLCTIGPDNSVCKGDSGGPIYQIFGETTKLVGIISYGKGFCSNSAQSTKVNAYLNWISHTTACC